MNRKTEAAKVYGKNLEEEIIEEKEIEEIKEESADLSLKLLEIGLGLVTGVLGFTVSKCLK